MWQPQLSPDGSWVAFLRGPDLYVAPFRGNQAVPETDWLKVAPAAEFPFWSPNGCNLYSTQGREDGAYAVIMRQSFDPKSGRPVGKPGPFHSLVGRVLPTQS